MGFYKLYRIMSFGHIDILVAVLHPFIERTSSRCRLRHMGVGIPKFQPRKSGSLPTHPPINLVDIIHHDHTHTCVCSCAIPHPSPYHIHGRHATFSTYPPLHHHHHTADVSGSSIHRVDIQDTPLTSTEPKPPDMELEIVPPTATTTPLVHTHLRVISPHHTYDTRTRSRTRGGTRATIARRGNGTSHTSR